MIRRAIASTTPLTVASGERPDSSLQEEAANQAVVGCYRGCLAGARTGIYTLELLGGNGVRFSRPLLVIMTCLLRARSLDIARVY